MLLMHLIACCTACVTQLTLPSLAYCELERPTQPYVAKTKIIAKAQMTDQMAWMIDNIGRDD